MKNLIILLSLLVLAPVCALTAEPPFELPKDVNRLKSAVIYTDYGNIEIDLFPQDAPWHVANFKYLADKGFYRNSKFHIFKPGYIIQGGDPSGSGRGGPGYTLPPEFNDRKHGIGTLGMARVADQINPERDSHGSQFYITLDSAPHMNGNYTIFGQVRSGLDVVNQLQKDDRIIDIKVFVRESKAQ